MSFKIFMLLALLCALSVVIDARPAGGAPRTVSLPVLPPGSFGPYPGAAPAGLDDDDDDYEDDPLDALLEDTFGFMGKLLGGGGGGGGKKLLIIG